MREWNRKNPEKKRRNDHLSYLGHKEIRLAANKRRSQMRGPEYERDRSRRRRIEENDKIKIWAADYRERNREELREKSRKRNRLLPAGYWSKLRHKYYWQNPEKYRTIAKVWAKANPEKVRMCSRARRARDPELDRRTWWKNIEHNRQRGVIAAHKRQARLKAVRNDLTLEQWLGIKEFYENKCVYCGATNKPLTIDHIQPISKGGEHTASNIAPACKSCNSRKWNKLLPDPILAQLRGESGRALIHGEPIR